MGRESDLLEREEPHKCKALPLPFAHGASAAPATVNAVATYAAPLVAATVVAVTAAAVMPKLPCET